MELTISSIRNSSPYFFQDVQLAPIVTKVSEVGIELLKLVLPNMHGQLRQILVAPFPWTVFKEPFTPVFIWFGGWGCVAAQTLLTDPSYSSSTAKGLIPWARTVNVASIGAITSLAQRMFFPRSIRSYVSLQLALIAPTLVSNLQLMQAAYEQLTLAQHVCSLESLQDPLAMASIIYGIALLVLGATLMISATQRIMRLVQGAQIAMTLDPDQLNGVLKHGTLHQLAIPKMRTAVIIDGDCAGPRIDDAAAWPQVKAISEYCETRFYRVNNEAEFVNAIHHAKEKFGGKFDVLATLGHADPGSQDLGKDSEGNIYCFEATDTEANAIGETCSDQVFMLGCNTGTQEGSDTPVAARLAAKVPGLRVTGATAYLSPLTSNLSYKNGSFTLSSWYSGESTPGSRITKFKRFLSKICFNSAKVFHFPASQAQAKS